MEMRKFLSLGLALLTVFVADIVFAASLEDFVESAFYQYEYCARNAFESPGFNYEVFEDSSIIFHNYYVGISPSGVCFEQAQAMKLQLEMEFSELSIRLVEGREKTFFSGGKHVYLEVNDSIIIDPSLKRFGLISEFEGVYCKIGYCHLGNKKDLHLLKNQTYPLYFIDSDVDTLIGFGINEYGLFQLRLDVEVGRCPLIESVNYYLFDDLIKAHPGLAEKIDFLRQVNKAIIEER